MPAKLSNISETSKRSTAFLSPTTHGKQFTKRQQQLHASLEAIAAVAITVSNVSNID